MYPHHIHQRCIDNAIHDAELICHHKGLRFTNLRHTVLEVIWASHQPIKAYDILVKLKDSNYSAKPPTVYRSLNFLLKNNIIHKLNSLNAYVGCSHLREHDQCYFLICNRCKEIKEFCNDKLDQAITKTIAKNKFNRQHTMLEIVGTCSACMMQE